MTQINDYQSLKDNHKLVRAEITEVLKKYGLKVVGSHASIGGGQIKFAIKTSFENEAEVTERERKTYEIYAPMKGLPKDGFGRVFRANGTDYKIVGVQPSKPKNFLKLERVRDGKGFQSSVEFVRPHMMSAEGAPK